MKLKTIHINFLLMMAFLSGCTSFAPASEQPAPRHLPPPMGWNLTDNLSIHTKDFDLDVLHVIIMPEYIMLISAVSGDLGTNDITEVNVLDGQQQPQGQTRVTTIRDFKQGKLIALTFFGNRQSMPKPLFLVTSLAGKNNTVTSGNWQVAPLELPQGAEDRGGTFMNGVISAKIGTVTIFSSGNHNSPICKGNTGIGGPDEIAFFTMVVSEKNGNESCLYTYIAKGGKVSELSEAQYLLKLPHP